LAVLPRIISAGPYAKSSGDAPVSASVRPNPVNFCPLFGRVLPDDGRPPLTYSVEKLSDCDRRKNPTALESLKFPQAEGTAAFDDLRAQIRSVRYTSRFPRFFGRISIQLKNRFVAPKRTLRRQRRSLRPHGLQF
jgi:hypothetical protein